MTSAEMMPSPAQIRRSLEQSLSNVTSQGPYAADEFFHDFVNTLNSGESAILNEIAHHEDKASSLLESIEVAISNPEQSIKQEADFHTVAQTYVQSSKTLSFNIQEFAETFAEMSQIADSKFEGSSLFVEEFKVRRLSKPWSQASLSKIVVLYSDIFEALRELKVAARAAKTGNKSEVWVAPDSFERKTTKYWVPEENLPQLLMTCASEAPFLVYGKSGRLSKSEDDNPIEDVWENLSCQISSIYFDSPQLSLYKERIKRKEGAQLLRARWYGEKPPTPDRPVFLELKTHHESWIQAKSVKERVAILEKDMNTFLYSIDSIISEDFAKSLVLAAAPKLKDKKLAKAVDLLLRMHTLVVRHKLRPCVRSTYDRLAFQSSKNNSLRLTLDRKVVVSDERGCEKGEQWFMPFTPGQSLPDGHDRKTIPFAVFEIKLGEGQESTALNECIENGTILDAAKFSKFLTGAATFNEVDHLPYWADHPAFASFFNHMLTSPLQSSPHGNIMFYGRTESPTASSSSSAEMQVPRQDDKKTKFSFFTGKLKGGKFVAPKKAVRIEPKTYFANERTYIQWVSAALFLVTLSALLLEFENGLGYAKLTAIYLLIFALVLAVYSVGLYYYRIWLMTNARPNGYITHFGPLLLICAVFTGTGIMLSKIRYVESMEQPKKSAVAAQNKVRFVQAEPGICMQHDTSSFSPLEFEPSDALVDLSRGQLLIPSLSEIYGFPLPDWNDEGILEIPNVSPTVVAKLELATFEAATMLNDNTMYAISETDTTNFEQSANMFSLERNSFGRFEVTSQWELELPEIERMAIVAQDEDSLLISGHVGEGSLSAVIQRFEAPQPNESNESTVTSSNLFSSTVLESNRALNERLLDANMNDPKIGAMTYFEGIVYVLHKNARVVRAWDMEKGTLQAEWPLPGVPNSSSKNWEGLAFQRIQRPQRLLSIQHSPANNNPKNNLRRRRMQTVEGETDDDEEENEEEEDDDEEEEVVEMEEDDDEEVEVEEVDDKNEDEGTEVPEEDDENDNEEGTEVPEEDDENDNEERTEVPEEDDENDNEEGPEEDDEDKGEVENEEVEEAEKEDTSVLVLHLTHDTPAIIWSIVVEEGDVKGSIEYPECADVYRQT